MIFLPNRRDRTTTEPSALIEGKGFVSESSRLIFSRSLLWSCRRKTDGFVKFSGYMREFSTFLWGEEKADTCYTSASLMKMKNTKKRKSPRGKATNDLIFSAYQGTNDSIFPHVLALYVRPGSTVADVTYGKGVFWKGVLREKYKLLATDLKTGVDCRSLPYESGSLDCLVFDPPYMHTPGGTAHVNHQNYENYYANNVNANGTTKKYHEAVLDLYFKTANEAKRVLRNEGVFIVKCGDEVCANQQRLTHVELINEFSQHGFVIEDLFVLLRSNRPGVSRVLRQVHARKNHSYFLVFRKSKIRRLLVPANAGNEERPGEPRGIEVVPSAS